MKVLTVIVFAVLAIGISMGAGKYNACHQDCCDRSFSNYNTMQDTCDIDSTVLQTIYDNYTYCMETCDSPEPEPSAAENKYDACHQDCCDRSFSQYSTMSDVCNIDPETVAPNIYSDYQICMTSCDKPEPTLYDEVRDVAANITPNLTTGSDKPNTTTIKKTNATGTDEGASGGTPFCAPAVAFLAIAGLLYKR